MSPQSPSKIDTPVRVAYVGDGKFLATIERSGWRSLHGLGAGPGARRRRGWGAHDQPSSCSRDRLPGRDPQAVPRGTLRAPSRGRRRGAAPRGHPGRGGGPEQPVTTSRARWSTTCSRRRTSSTTPTSATSPARACRRVECFARFREGYCQYYATTMAILLRERGIPTRLAAGSCRATATMRNSSSACRSARRMPGSRSTSPDTAGWSSTRPAVASPKRSRCRPANRSPSRPPSTQAYAAASPGGPRSSMSLPPPAPATAVRQPASRTSG